MTVCIIISYLVLYYILPIFLSQTRMNVALIMENVYRNVTIHMEVTTVLVIVDMYSLLIKKTVMVRRYSQLYTLNSCIGFKDFVTVHAHLPDI